MHFELHKVLIQEDEKATIENYIENGEEKKKEQSI